MSSNHGIVSRSLLSSHHTHKVTPPFFRNCTHAAIKRVIQYEILFTLEQRRHGAVLFHMAVCLYSFAALAILCEDYFCASLDRLCSRLRIPTDVAGATFMAAGSSMPTLFIGVASVFMGEVDIGLGTIIGSTMFNILFITSMCGLCSGMIISLNPWPLLRDSIVYVFHLVVLLVVVSDGIVHWYESSLFLFTYTGYIILMCFNKSLERFTLRRITDCNTCEEIKERPTLMEKANVGGEDGDQRAEETDINIEAQESEADQQEQPHKDESKNEESEDILVVEEFEKEPRHPLKLPDGRFHRVFWIVMFPVHLLYYLTMPDCRRKRWEAWYPATFLLSITWMALLSYVLVWAVSVIGETIGTPECIMGLTLLAGGSSVPDLFASLVVAKHGNGDMAIANCVGSNIFDILCLGLPWLLYTTIVKPDTVVVIQSGNIVYTSLSLFGTVIITILCVHLNRWKLDKRLGCVLLCVYVACLGSAVLLEAM